MHRRRLPHDSCRRAPKHNRRAGRSVLHRCGEDLGKMLPSPTVYSMRVSLAVRLQPGPLCQESSSRQVPRGNHGHVFEGWSVGAESAVAPTAPTGRPEWLQTPGVPGDAGGRRCAGLLLGGRDAEVCAGGVLCATNASWVITPRLPRKNCRGAPCNAGDPPPPKDSYRGDSRVQVIPAAPVSRLVLHTCRLGRDAPIATRTSRGEGIAAGRFKRVG